MNPVDTHFERASYPPEAFSYQHYMTHFGLSKAQAKRQVATMKAAQVVVSTTHQVEINVLQVNPGRVTWLSIKRRDRSPVLQRMELAPIAEALTPGCVALELLPHQERIVDTANQYHCFSFPLIMLEAFNGSDWATPPHLGDWRELQEWKETQFPEREAALIVAGGGDRTGQVMVVPTGVRFPFGFASGSITGDSIGRAVQRPFSD